MNIEIIIFVMFVLILGLVLLLNRKKLVLQKIFYPFLYLILYRTKLGIKLMNKIATMYNEVVKLFGYCSIGFAFLGMIYISVSILFFILKLIFRPDVSQPGVSLVLPFTNIPGIGYLSFTHWIIGIFVLAVIHEFAHGVVARAHGLKVKSSGFAFFALLLPIIPAAFVEPDEKQLSKKSDIVQYSVFSAGPMINILFAVMLLLALPYVGDSTNSVLAPYEDRFTEPVGFSYETLENDSYPVYLAGIPSGTLEAVNGVNIDNYVDFYKEMLIVSPGDSVLLTTDSGDYGIIAIESEDDPEKGFIGIRPVQNERRIIEGKEFWAPVYYWFRGMIKWMFLLNFFIGLANLLPLGIVDGGRMLHVALHKIMKNKKKAQKTWVFIAFLFLGFLLFALFVNYFGNPLSWFG